MTLLLLSMLMALGPADQGGNGRDSELSASAAIDLVSKAQARRVATIERVIPSVVCIYDLPQRGGGSGVLIDPEGYGLTNFHVVHGLRGSTGWGGLSDGQLYHLEVLGVDPTGDVAMFRLVGRDAFPFAKLGDSDAVQVGDDAYAMGNPFSLSEDQRPTVTMGIVTGTHRYQSGVEGNLTYTDCIQVDAAINPGNSGGPLFNAAGEVIGINGRISINQRGRYNVGFGYAIASNQIKRFVPALRAGLLARHGNLQALVEDREGQGVIFTELVHDAPAYDAGIRIGDRLLEFDGVPITSANHFASLLGTYPADWVLPLTTERDGVRSRRIACLEPITPKLKEPFDPDAEVNFRQVRRVVQAHQAAVMNDRHCLTGEWHWTIERRYDQAVTAKANPIETFDAIRWNDGTLQLIQRSQGEMPGRIIECYENHAVQRDPSSGTSTALPLADRLVIEATRILQRQLLGPLDDLDPSEVTDAGGLSPFTESSNQPSSGTEPLEVLEWQLGDRALARFAFDPATHWVDRIIVVDLPTNRRYTITAAEHRDVGGVILPCRLRVTGANIAYEDTLTDWQVLP